MAPEAFVFAEISTAAQADSYKKSVCA